MARPQPVDPIQAGPETAAFWHMVAHNVALIQVAEASGKPPPPPIQKAIDQPYRLSYICQHCDSIHRVEGDYEQVSMAVQVLLLQGAKSVQVDTLEHALVMDAEDADEMVADPAPGSGAERINHQLQEQFFSGKPRT